MFHEKTVAFSIIDLVQSQAQELTSQANSLHGTIEVAINGVPQNRITNAKPAEGRIGFQLEGAPYELRNVTLEKL